MNAEAGGGGEAVNFARSAVAVAVHPKQPLCGWIVSQEGGNGTEFSFGFIRVEHSHTMNQI